ncbi:MAG: hypothetical protein CM15mP64_2980 [Candidatus Neomarinimicrobiota bacterium]|nr:MAG: hypothetical protein CM15mP64_2980 [Candidatus Neomarinimicrobiota bacterium]
MSKKINIALFGFGRIGRNLFRLGYDNPNYNFVAVSDFGSAEALHYLTSTRLHSWCYEGGGCT